MASRPSVKPTGLSLAKAWYDRARLWVVYGSVLLVILVLYLGSFLGPVRTFLLPAALGVLTAFAVQSLQVIERQTGPQVTENEFLNVFAAIPMLRELVEDDREITDVKVIAATGWTTARQVLPAIVDSSKATTIRIALQVIEPSGPLNDAYPKHWAGEVVQSLSRIADDFADPRLTVSVSAYRYLPPVHGLLVNDQHLLVGFFGWASVGGRAELAGAERPHRLYRRGEPASSQLFEIFDEWFQHVPRKGLLTIPSAMPN
jgi:hypothetical protein